MNARQHARLARALVTACGGLEEAAGACRLKKSRLADFQDPATDSFMPADVMADLEVHCGDPLYSRALFEAHLAKGDAGALAEEACRATEIAAQIQALARCFGARRLTETVRRQLAGDLKALEAPLRAMLAIVDAEGGS